VNDSNTSRNFTCSDCGRGIWQLCGPNLGDVCAACLMMPQWWLDPNLARQIDPDNLRNPAAPQ